MTGTLLIEIGCEEIPARMIAAAARDLAARIAAILDEAGLGHGAARAWGGPRRLAVSLAAVDSLQASRDETVLGPPVAAAFAADGTPTPAGGGFARKHGIEPAALERIETPRGVYAGFRRTVAGRTLGAILAEALPEAVAGMSFPKTMRWGEGTWRWVRPVHWLVVLHGADVLPVTLFGARAERNSRGHRFLAPGAVPIAHADDYAGALRAAHVVTDPAERRRLLRESLDAAARGEGGALVEDAALLDEVVDLVEWPGVVTGRFPPAFLDLPNEVLVTTLRHHQKAFSVRGPQGLLPVFLAVANTDRDPAGHVRRGNEWVVTGRLEDARFFWDADRKHTLETRVPALARIVFHERVGSYADTTARALAVVDALGAQVGLAVDDRARAREALALAKADLVTGLVGEFPELQGIVGGLLLEAAGADPAIARAVYEHYRPAAADDALPGGDLASVVAVADKLACVGALLAAGETPTGSRDPFGLRRALNGVVRIALDRRWPVSPRAIAELAAAGEGAAAFVRERVANFFRDRGFTPNEVACVLAAGHGAAMAWPLASIAARLEAIAAIRGRADFAHLVDLTKRVANIRKKNPDLVIEAESETAPPGDEGDPEATAAALAALLGVTEPETERLAEAEAFADVVDRLARFVAPVDAFFDRALVVNPDDGATTRRRLRLLGRLESILTRYFDLRELPGEAERRA